MDRCYEAKGCLGEPGLFVFAQKNVVSNYEAMLKGASSSMMGTPIVQPLIPFHPLSNHVCHHRHGHSVIMVDCQADMHELAYRVMCMPWVKRTEHVGFLSDS